MVVIGTETYYDPDGRSYRIRFAKRNDGSFRAYLESSPWSEASMNAFTSQQTHLNYINDKRRICLAKDPIYDLDAAKKRAAFWCTGFSYLMEHGYNAIKSAIPDW